MMKIWLYLLLVTIFFETIWGTSLKCNSKDNCLCFPSSAEFEFQCPPNYAEVGGFVIHIKEKDVLIDCYSNSTTFDLNLLPNVTLSGIEDFSIRFCPLPEEGFKQVLDWFSIEEIKYFQFANANLSNVILTKRYFEGMDYLQRLSLDMNSLYDVDEDVFANTPNLTSIELKNNALKLKSGLFTNTPHLKWLDLAQNNLDDLPEGFFSQLDKLEVLHLWDNKLKTINENTFSGLWNLKSLELSANNIEEIAENAFVKLSKLKEINMSKNLLTSLSSNTFARNKNLEMISLNSNQNLTVPPYLFSNITRLSEVDLGNCKLKSIPGNIFQNSDNLRMIKLGSNSLTRIPEELFNGLQKIETIHLFNNKLESIKHEFKSLGQLKTLLLQNNAIFDVGQSAFDDLSNLEEINLQQNRIKTINHTAFYKTVNLKTINLSHNQYSGETNLLFNLLENVRKAEVINLSYNLISHIDAVITTINKIYLTHLDLSHNYITTVFLQDLQPLNPKLLVNLEYNNITTVNFDQVELIATSGDKKDIYSSRNPFNVEVLLGHNPLNCDCNIYDLVNYIDNRITPEIKVMYDLRTADLNCANPPELKRIPVNSIPPHLLRCPLQERITNDTGCPDQCSCGWRPFDSSVIINCSNQGFTEFPSIGLDQMRSIPFTQLEVHLENNFLKTGPNNNMSGYDYVTKLFLSNNQITSLAWIPSNIKVLHLDNNELTHLEEDVLQSLNISNVTSLTLYNNFWSCDCDALNLVRFLRLKQIDAKNIFCANSTKLLIEQNRSDLCNEWLIAYSILIVVICLLVVSTVVALYYCYKEEIKVWLYAHNLCLWWVTEEELDKDKIYDAFISYSHKDEEFVVQNLLAVLEGGPNPYKLCIHYRNFIPGEFITTQVTNSVLESRRTVVVLSPNFLESVWGKLEFRTAHTHAMTEGRTRVIIVLYGDVDVEKLDDELKAYMKTNTYVKWGDPYFWNKLKYALPHSKHGVSNNNKQKIANVMNCIDDKFNLVTPVKSSPGTTPPVLAEGNGKLRKHPLNFVISADSETPPAESGTLITTTGL